MAIRNVRYTACLLALVQILFVGGEREAVSQIQTSPKQVTSEDADSKSFEVTGTCMSMEESNPIEGVELTLFEVTGPGERIRELQRTTSDPTGAYLFKDLAPVNQSRIAHRSYIVKAVANGCPDVAFRIRNSFDVQNFAAAQLRMHSGTGSIKGKVTDEKGNPLAGAIVHWSFPIPVLPSEVGLRMAKTNKEGLFILSGLPLIDGKPRSLRAAYLKIEHPAYPKQLFERKSLEFSTFVMTPGGAVEGIVIDEATQKPLTGIALTAQPADTKYESREAKTMTDDQGRYRMMLVEGNYNLIMDDPKYVAKYSYMECRKGGTLKLQPIQATVGGWIVGQVINTDTNQPEVMAVVGDDQSERIGVGLFGPDRPMGRLIHTHWLDEVDDDGRFRILAHPGENYPYLCNLRGKRTTWETMKQPPVVVEAGKETRYDMVYEPPRTPEQKMAKGKAVLDKLPADVDGRVAGIIAQFRELNNTVDECEIWCLLMKELVRIGKPAVPALCKELEATDSPTMMRRLAFALRAIGDPQAVPALIRTISKTLQPSMSDYGLVVEDPDLMTFMQTHDLDEKGRAAYFDLGRPMREVYGALNKLTKRTQDVNPLSSISRSPDQRALARQEKIYYDAAREWSDWWESHWKEFDVDQAYSKVNLPEFKPRDVSGYPVGLSLTKNATLGSGMQQLVLTPVGDADKSAHYLMDLDTGQDASLPKELQSKDDSPESVEAVRKYAAEKGFDLMCVSEVNADGVADYTLVGVDLELWEIDPNDAKKLEELVTAGKLPEGRKLKDQRLLHRQPDSQADTSSIGSCFLYVTKDQGLGVIMLTDFVVTAQDVTGLAVAPRGVGFYRGVQITYQQIAR